eukprot:TRINITY_DN4880_c1_g1_i4.p1 TRINITY_DN4880_c1_g1~~TRINITY_DN4880_c1_g1_i4.p1  ORF type:complete len:264 (-),score=25.20 TRINITY_DN4880_c1_g1_i4:920-1711(-)
MSLEHAGNFVFRCGIPMGVSHDPANHFDDKADIRTHNKEIGPVGAHLYGLSVDTAPFNQPISLQSFYCSKDKNKALVCPKRGNLTYREGQTNTMTITFDRDEWVVRVEVWWWYQVEQNSDIMHAFRVLTNKNRWISFWYHTWEPQGDHTYIEIPNGFQLAGFFGTHLQGGGISSLGIYISPVLAILYKQLPSSFMNLAKVYLETIVQRFSIPNDVRHQLYKAFVRTTFQREWTNNGPENGHPVLEELMNECQKLLTLKFIPAA